MLDLKRMGDKKYLMQGATNGGLGQTRNTNGNHYTGDDGDNNIGGYNNNSDDSRNNFNSTNTQFRVKNAKNNLESNVFISDKPRGDDLLGATNKKTTNDPQNNQNEGLKFLSFDIEDMKLRYIFPFNDNFKRKSNYKLTDNSNLIQP